MREPRASRMNSGFASTDRNARTGLFTPPGMRAFACSKRISDVAPIQKYDMLVFLNSSSLASAR